MLPVFAMPWLLLLAPLAVLFVYWRRGRTWGRLRFSSMPWRDLPAGRGRRAGRIGAALQAFSLVALTVALAGPRWPDPGSRVATHGIAIAMVVDVSGSMASPDYQWHGKSISRLDAVKKAFRFMIEGGSAPAGERLPGRPDDLVELVVYATRPETACPLTLNHDVLLKILDEQSPRTLITEATTNTGDAIAWAVASLQRAPVRHKAIVLLTDGEHNVPPPALKPRQAAQLAGNLGIPIYAIHAGNELGEDGKSTDEAVRARQSLEDVARISGGKYFQAADSKALLDACTEIDELEREVIPSFHYRLYYEGFAWFALAALAGLLASHLLESTIWRRVP